MIGKKKPIHNRLSKQSILSGSISEYGAVKIVQSTGADIKLLSIATISYWNSQDTGTIIAENNGKPKSLWDTFKKNSTYIFNHHLT